MKGVGMEIIPAIWTMVTRLKYSGAKVGKGNSSAIEDINKMQYYVIYLRNLNTSEKE